MLSNAVQPPMTEHIYAQWREREELGTREPLGVLQGDNVQPLEVKQEKVASPLSSEPTSRNNFKSTRATRLKFKGNVTNRAEKSTNKAKTL